MKKKNTGIVQSRIKDTRAVFETAAGIKDAAQSGAGSESTARTMVAAYDVGADVAKTYVKGHIAYEKLTKGTLLSVNVKLSQSAFRKVKEIRRIQKEMLMSKSAASTRTVRYASPKIRGHSLSSATAEKAQMRFSESMTVTTQPAVRSGEYDVSKIAEKNGIQSHGEGVRGISSKAADAEERNGIRQRGSKQKNLNTELLSERKTPQGEDIVRTAEERNGLKSKNPKDNLAKKKNNKEKKKSKHEKKKGSLAKQEAKQFVMKQLLEEESNPDAGSGVGAMAGNIMKGKVRELFSRVLKSVGRLLYKIAGAIILFLLRTVGKVMLYLFLAASLLVLFFLLIIGAAAGIIVGAVYLILGFFGFGSSGQPDSVITYIQENKAVIEELAEDYDEITYHYCSDLYGNDDDILLAYLTKVTDFSGDAINEDSAPYFTLDSNEEKNAIDSVLDKMLYYKTGFYEVEIEVTVTPAPSPSITTTPTPTAAIEQPGAEENAQATPTPALAPSVDVTPTPTPVPKKETITIVETITTIDIYVLTVDEWKTQNSLNAEEEEIYKILRELYESMGFSPGGGSAVSDLY